MLAIKDAEQSKGFYIIVISFVKAIDDKPVGVIMQLKQKLIL